MTTETLSSYPDNSIVNMVDYTCQPDEGGFIIGYEKTGTFLAIPEEAEFVAQLFKEQQTLGTVKQRYFAKYGEAADLDDFIDVLCENGLANMNDTGVNMDQLSSVESTNQAAQPNYHFDNIPVKVAQLFFSKITALLWITLFLAAAWAMLSYPEIIPNSKDLVFKSNYTINMFSLFILSTFCVFLHEMAHLLAARAQGVSSRLGLSHRLWFLVAETDMTGIWSVAKKDRYIPFISGPLLDIAIGAITLLVLAGTVIFNWPLSASAIQFLKAFAFTTFLRLIWQCYFFIRTDFYFVFSAFFNCRSLMEDTKTYLGNQFKKLFRRGNLTDQSAIPEKEFRVVRYYSIFWLIGQSFAFFIFFSVMLPVTWLYIKMLFGNVSEGTAAGLYTFIDSSLIIIISLVVNISGLTLWIRSIQANRVQKNKGTQR